jgi:hypothetical protein
MIGICFSALPAHESPVSVGWWGFRGRKGVFPFTGRIQTPVDGLVKRFAVVEEDSRSFWAFLVRIWARGNVALMLEGCVTG